MSTVSGINSIISIFTHTMDLVPEPGFNGEYPKKELMIEFEYDRYGEKYTSKQSMFILSSCKYSGIITGNSIIF